MQNENWQVQSEKLEDQVRSTAFLDRQLTFFIFHFAFFTLQWPDHLFGVDSQVNSNSRTSRLTFLASKDPQVTFPQLIDFKDESEALYELLASLSNDPAILHVMLEAG